jgi:hypothetical protein
VAYEMRVIFQISGHEDLEERLYDDTDFLDMDEFEISQILEQDLDDWVKNQLEYSYEIIEE